MGFYLPEKWRWKNLIMFQCSQKGEYVLLPRDYFYEILFIGCSKFAVEIRNMAGRNKTAFTCSVSASMCVWQWVSLYYFIQGKLFPCLTSGFLSQTTS